MAGDQSGRLCIIGKPMESQPQTTRGRKHRCATRYGVKLILQCAVAYESGRVNKPIDNAYSLHKWLGNHYLLAGLIFLCAAIYFVPTPADNKISTVEAVVVNPRFTPNSMLLSPLDSDLSTDTVPFTVFEADLKVSISYNDLVSVDYYTTSQGYLIDSITLLEAAQ